MQSANVQQNSKPRKVSPLAKKIIMLILIIATLAVAVFAGASAVMNRAKVNQTTADLHNFATAIESFMIDKTPSIASITHNPKDINGALNILGLCLSLNANLPTDLQLEQLDGINPGDVPLDALNNFMPLIFKSAKTDAWGNHYYILLDFSKRSKPTSEEFYITVVSAGSDEHTELQGKIGSDDLFMLAEYKDGTVSSVTYNMATDHGELQGAEGSIQKGQALYAYKNQRNIMFCPVNF